MHITQLKLAKSKQAAPILSRFLSATYAEHQVLWELAGREATAKRDFLYRAEMMPEGLELMVLSEQPLTAVPEPWVMRSKEYRPVFRQGQMLEFKLRTSLTVQKARAGQRSQRQDLVMDCYRELEGRVPLQEAAQSAAEQWLNARATSSGFRLVDCSASNYHRITVLQKARPFKIPSTDLSGIVEVADPDLFLRKQLSGFGSTRFAGLGLMLVKPV